MSARLFGKGVGFLWLKFCLIKKYHYICSMNKDRRKRLIAILTALLGMKALIISGKQEAAKVRSLADEVEAIADEEQEAVDSLPENLQFSQRADDMNDNISDLYDVSGLISEYADALEDPDDGVSEEEFDENYGEIERLVDNVTTR